MIFFNFVKLWSSISNRKCQFHQLHKIILREQVFFISSLFYQSQMQFLIKTNFSFNQWFSERYKEKGVEKFTPTKLKKILIIQGAAQVTVVAQVLTVIVMTHVVQKVIVVMTTRHNAAWQPEVATGNVDTWSSRVVNVIFNVKTSVIVAQIIQQFVWITTIIITNWSTMTKVVKINVVIRKSSDLTEN